MLSDAALRASDTTREIQPQSGDKSKSFVTNTGEVSEVLQTQTGTLYRYNFFQRTNSCENTFFY